jgi:probable HAF family extracellular repeat protein
MRRLLLGLLGAGALLSFTSSPATVAAAGEPPGRGCSQDVCVFVLDRGQITAFDTPGLGPAEFQRINNQGQIVGSYMKGADAPLAGYLRDERGRITQIAVPGAVTTSPLGIDDHGEIVGNFQREVGGAFHGFLRDERGRYTTIDVPGAVATQAFGINNRGQVVGGYTGADGVPHGYLWTGGRVTTIDGPQGTGATLTSVNDRGQIVGVYQPSAATPGRLDGFLLGEGRYTPFDLDDAALTVPLGINNRGEIAGFTGAQFTATAASQAHGFVLRRGAGGPATRIDVPGGLATGALGINDRGSIVGVYVRSETAPSA